MTEKQMRQETEEFFRSTWAAWRAGVLSRYLPATAEVAAVPLDTFLESCDDVKHEAIATFLAEYAPKPGEFLIGFDGANGGRPSFILTSNRIVVRDKENGSYSALNLRNIQSFKDKGWWTKAYTVTTPDGTHIFAGLDSVPKDEIMSFAIESARETPPWGDVTAHNEQPAEVPPSDSEAVYSVRVTVPEGPPTAFSGGEAMSDEQIKFWQTTKEQWESGYFGGAAWVTDMHGIADTGDGWNSSDRANKPLCKFLDEHAPRDGEFLAIYSATRRRLNYLLTSERLWLMDRKTKEHSTYELADVASYECKPRGWHYDTTICLKDGSKTTQSCSAAPDSEIMAVCIARKNGAANWLEGILKGLVPGKDWFGYGIGTGRPLSHKVGQRARLWAGRAVLGMTADILHFETQIAYLLGVCTDGSPHLIRCGETTGGLPGLTPSINLVAPNSSGSRISVEAPDKVKIDGLVLTFSPNGRIPDNKEFPEKLRGLLANVADT